MARSVSGLPSPGSEMDKWEVQLRKGCLELVILCCLWPGKLYGLEILRRLENDSNAARPRPELKIATYFARVRVALRGLPEREIDDILRELRSHVDELADASEVEAALESLGDPLDLARTYRSQNQMVRAECSGSPLVILPGLRYASRGTFERTTVTALYVLGYFGMGTLWAGALEKLLAPSRGGLWYTPGDFRSLTLVVGGNPPANARELLGWWVVPWIRRHRGSTASQEV